MPLWSLITVVVSSYLEAEDQEKTSTACSGERTSLKDVRSVRLGGSVISLKDVHR